MKSQFMKIWLRRLKLTDELLKILAGIHIRKAVI